MPDASPDQHQRDNDPAPKVDGTIGNAGVGIGWGVKQIAGSLAGDNGIRLLALAFVASVTWVATWSITRYTEMQSTTESMLVRVGEERVEREKADRGRAEKEMREWMASETEKTRQNFSANVSFLTKEFAAESERNRAMVFKLAGAGKANPAEFPTAEKIVPNEIRPE